MNLFSIRILHPIGRDPASWLVVRLGLVIVLLGWTLTARASEPLGSSLRPVLTDGQAAAWAIGLQADSQPGAESQPAANRAGLALSSTAAESSIDPTIAEAERVALIAEVSRSVVAIFSPDGGGGGSGVIISPDGFALSNFHVTSAVGDHMKCGLNDGQLYDAVIVGLDPTGDVALLKLLGRDDFPTAIRGDSDELRVGDWVYVMGNPFLLAADFQPTVTYGIVSGVHRYQYPAGTILEYADCIQVDASINPGNSGGPLFDAAGRLVGINGRGSFEKRGRVNVGAGYAISINQIERFLDLLKAGRIADHATLGATLRTGPQGELFVDQILESSSAYRRGLRSGDQLLAIDGRRLTSINQFKNILGTYPQGWHVPLSFRQGKETVNVTVELMGVHSLAEMQSAGAEPPPHHPGMPQPPKPAVPESVTAQLEKKAGFANFHFNRLEQRRVLAGLEQQRTRAIPAGRWKLQGDLADGGTFQLLLTDGKVGLRLQAVGGRPIPYLYDPQTGEGQDDPPGTGGLLAALQAWQQLWVRGPDSFGEVTYWGSRIDEAAGLVDVITATRGDRETNWLFDRKSGQFVGFDLRLDSEREPCELRFSDWKLLGGAQLPGQIEVRSAGRLRMRLKVQEATLEGASDTPAVTSGS